MHQLPRTAQRSSASAASPQANSFRTNSQRESLSSRTPSLQDLSLEEGRRTPTLPEGARALDDGERARLNQVVQRFFTKAALIILLARVSLQPIVLKNGEAKSDRWFNTLTEDTDALKQDLLQWQTMDCFQIKPAPLIIEVYIDLAQLAQNQSLVAIDDEGETWDVSEVLERMNAATSTPSARIPSRIVCERWTISLDDATSVPAALLTDQPPVIYKKSVVVMRSLYTYVRYLPAWRFARRLGRQGVTGPTLKLKYRIADASPSPPHLDTLSRPLFPSEDPTTQLFHFTPLHCVFGSLHIQVEYRPKLQLDVESSERLLSRGMTSPRSSMAHRDRHQSMRERGEGVEGLRHRESVAHRRAVSATSGSHNTRNYSDADMGHLASDRNRQVPTAAVLANSPRNAVLDQDRANDASTGLQRPQSPRIDQIRPHTTSLSSQRPSLQYAESGRQRTSSLRQPSPSLGGDADARPASSVQSRPLEAPIRRTSVSFQPFKAGSLSSSPAAATYMPSSSPGSSAGRSANSSTTQHTRNRSSLTTLPQQALRNPQLSTDNTVTSSASSSPKPAPIQRYSSSFGNRKARFPSISGSRMDEETLSSGRASVASNRGSGSLTDGRPSSMSGPTDDDHIADFLKLLGESKNLKSFAKNDEASMNANSQRQAAQYSRYSRMKDSNAQLTESMSSSLMLHRSSISSSRQLQNVPGMIAGSSLSTSSSPGKPMSPHTPHMPAVPSRLSNNSITADYSRERSRPRPAPANESTTASAGTGGSRALSPTQINPASTAIDIPTSPRTFPAGRRSSSAAQQGRIRPPDLEEQEIMPFGLRSASLPVDERPELSLSELLMQAEGGGSAGSGGGRRRRDMPSAATVDDEDELLFALAE